MRFNASQAISTQNVLKGFYSSSERFHIKFCKIYSIKIKMIISRSCFLFLLPVDKRNWRNNNNKKKKLTEKMTEPASLSVTSTTVRYDGKVQSFHQLNPLEVFERTNERGRINISASETLFFSQWSWFLPTRGSS